MPMSELSMGRSPERSRGDLRARPDTPGRDFDWLARVLEERYRVVCVDLPGRGQSDWLPVAADYQPSTYIQDMAALIARLDVEQVDWIGSRWVG